MKPWYKEGLRFQCTGCGQCCTGFPGYVWVTEQEIQGMAQALQMPLDDFVQKYIRKVGNRYSLKERSKTYDCVLLEGKKCTVYHARPTQCQTFPWWQENLESPEHWEHASKNCEGINHPDAPLISLEEIEKSL